ncbi:MAG: riboflavin synthase [Pseudomonadota bacterium]
MFTGIVREVGQVRDRREAGDTTFRIGCARAPETIEIGASICCNGVCLTATATGQDDTGPWFEVDASAETLSKTTLGAWQSGTKVNLEPSLRLGDEMGGHIVSGHVDGLGEIVGIEPEGASHRVRIRTSKSLGRFIAQKGSIALDGISLTVNEVDDQGEMTTFGVNIIPHTWTVTSLADASVGSEVNLEIDLLARYVQRLAEAG